MRKLILVLCMVVMVFALVGCGQKEPIAEKTDAEKFAEKNSISVKLAESIENALSQTDVPSSLNKLNDWNRLRIMRRVSGTRVGSTPPPKISIITWCSM